MPHLTTRIGFPQINQAQALAARRGRAMTSRTRQTGIFSMAKPITAIVGAIAVFIAAPAAAQGQAWVERSNAITQQVIAMQAEFQPEGASQSGLERYDGLALDLGPDLPERFIAAEEAKLAELRAALAAESDPNVKQDIEILIDSLERDIEGTRLSQRLTLTWYDVPQLVFGNLNGVLDDQVAPERRAKAVELLQRYTGLYQGTTALTQLDRLDRKSTRLNSSHSQISYAVFCLKKKKKKKQKQNLHINRKL